MSFGEGPIQLQGVEVDVEIGAAAEPRDRRHLFGRDARPLDPLSVAIEQGAGVNTPHRPAQTMVPRGPRSWG